MKFENRVFGSILGLAVGDALGAPVEFKKRNSYPPVTNYLSGGEFNLPAGFYTDDTTLTLCILESLIEKNAFDLNDQMDRFISWWKYGHLSSTGFCFDIGNTTVRGLSRYLADGNPMAGAINDPATNGAIMRLAPIPIYYYHSLSKAIKFSILHTQTTHGPIECVEASIILAYILYFSLNGKSKSEILKFTHLEFKLTSCLNDIVFGTYKHKAPEEISGIGFAFNTLEAAIYAFYKFDNFIDGLLFVVNLGDDTDTVAAVYGQIAGSYYGIDSIPADLISGLHNEKMIKNKINKLLEKIL